MRGFALVWLAACTAPSGSEPVSDDTAVDASGDTVVDTSGDTAVDSSGDVAVDTSGDTAADTATDTGTGAPSFAGTFAASGADTIVYGSIEDGRFGLGLAAADLDGDGRAELVVSEPQADTRGTSAGNVWFVPGPLAQGHVAAASVATAMLYGEVRHTLGTRMQAAADLDGDDVPDLTLTHGNSGCVRLAGLPSGSVAVSDVAVESMACVSAEAPLRDWAGDGWAAWVDGDRTTPNGDACVYPGSAGGWSETPSVTLEGRDAGYILGYAVAGADTDGDGRDELWVSAPNADVVYVFAAGLAPVGTAAEDNATTELHRDDALVASWTFGTALLPAGDVDGDGADDVVIEGASGWFVVGAPPAGSAVVTDVALAWADMGEDADVRAAGDVTCDGAVDLVVGTTVDAGSAWLFSDLAHVGATDATGAVARFDGDDPGGQFGGAAAIGDVSGDGCADLAIGAAQDNGSGAGLGAAYVWFGRP